MKLRPTLVIGFLAFRSVAAGNGAPVGPGAAPGIPSRDELEKQALQIKAAPDELKWQQIPWVLDLAEGQRLAKTEIRPLLLWATGDDPLERC
jgi:hypothetical protein